MIFWGFVMWLVGGVAGILAILANLRTDGADIGIIDNLEFYGLGTYLSRLFDPQYISARKILFLVALVLVIAGLIVFFIGRKKVAKSGVPEKSGAKAQKYWRDMKGEYRKIVWPTFKSVVNNTAITLAVCALVAAFIVAVDYGLSALVNLLLKL